MRRLMSVRHLKPGHIVDNGAMWRSRYLVLRATEFRRSRRAELHGFSGIWYPGHSRTPRPYGKIDGPYTNGKIVVICRTRGPLLARKYLR